MKIRTRFNVLLAATSLVGVASLLAAVMAVRTMNEAARAQQLAQESLREARELLISTLETVLYGRDRSVDQWRKRYAALRVDLAAASAAHSTTVPAPQLEEELDAIKVLFDGLIDAASGVPDAALAGRRRELITDNLVATTQGILDRIFRWGTEVGAQRGRDERRLAVLAATAPLLFLFALGAVAASLSRRIMRPLGELQRAMREVEGGDLSVRRASAANDELGELANTFDGMTASLQSSLRRLSDNERRLRTITDNLPARISYIDHERRYRFANAACCRAFGFDEAAKVVGHTLEEVRGGDAYARIAPEVAAALRGERRSFVSVEDEHGSPRHNEYVLVPDRLEGGEVQGYYAMVHDISEYVRARQRAEDALAEKEILLKEIHHRVKNNMQVISSLLTLQSDHVENREALALLGDSQSRIRSMALIHEKLYQSHDLARVDFADYATTLARMIQDANAGRSSGIDLDIDAEPVWLSVDQAIPAGLILNELLSNSYKHAFPGGRAGRIAIGLRQAPGEEIRLRVADDGVGFPAGFVASEATTLGLRLIYILAGQLDASVTLGHRPGVECCLSFVNMSARSIGAANG